MTPATGGAGPGRRVVGLILVGASIAVLAGVAVGAGFGSGDGDDDGTASAHERREAPRRITTISTTSTPSTTLPEVLVTVPPPSTDPATTAPPRPEERVIDCAVEGLDRRQQVAQLVMVGVDATGTGQVADLLAGAAPVGGVFIGGTDDRIFAGDDLQRTIGSRPLLVAVDDEGGRVQRLDGMHGPMPSAREQASTMSSNEVRGLARRRGDQLRAEGVNVNFAPVVDVGQSELSTGVIGDRSYGADSTTVTRYATAFADGMRDAGVLPTLKHFPGHGTATGDSHRQVVVSPALDQMERNALVPFHEWGSSDHAVMVGHLDVPGLTEPGLPASLSPAAYRYLRSEIGFDGLVVTDELGGMAAVSSRFSAGEAAVRSIVAGADVALFADARNGGPAVDALTSAADSGELSDARIGEALRRVRTAQGC